MKTVKLVAALLMVAMCVGIVSCSKDEPGDGVFNGKRVTKIVHKYDDFVRTEEFSYLGDKLVHIGAYYDDYTDRLEYDLTITYKNNQVIMEGVADGYDAVFTYTLSSNGYATSCEGEIREGNRIEKENHKFEYSSDGYLTKIIGLTEESYGTETETREFTVNLTYAKGNLVSAREDYNRHSDFSNITYTNIENKGNLLFYHGALFIGDSDAYLALYTGILGKFSKNLVSGYTFTDSDENSSYTSNHTYSYTLDDEGYPVMLKETSTSSSGDDTYSETYIYTFE